MHRNVKLEGIEVGKRKRKRGGGGGGEIAGEMKKVGPPTFKSRAEPS